MSNPALPGLFVLVLCLFCGCSAGGGARPGLTLHRIQSSSESLAYVVYTPEHAPTPTPVILFLHGRGECGSDGWKHPRISTIMTDVMKSPDRWPFVIVMPQKPDTDKQWEHYDALVMQALERTIREQNLDRRRVYLTGLSQGGHGTWMFAAAHPDIFAAVAPICGYLDLREFRSGTTPAELAAKIDDVPVWCFHGDADNIVPASQSTVIMESLRAHRTLGDAGGSDTRFTVYKGVGHNAWDNAYAEPELPAWLLARRR